MLLQSFSVCAAAKSHTDSSRQIIVYIDSNTHAIKDSVNTPQLSSHISNLSVKPTEKGTLLSWVVQQTANLQYFLIEHSIDGQTFSPLFEVPIQPQQHHYSFVDNGLKARGKTIYYRIKAVYPTAILESPVRKLTV